jgi:hypothetical protein
MYTEKLVLLLVHTWKRGGGGGRSAPRETKTCPTNVDDPQVHVARAQSSQESAHFVLLWCMGYLM